MQRFGRFAFREGSTDTRHPHWPDRTVGLILAIVAVVIAVAVRMFGVN